MRAPPSPRCARRGAAPRPPPRRRTGRRAARRSRGRRAARGAWRAATSPARSRAAGRSPPPVARTRAASSAAPSPGPTGARCRRSRATPPLRRGRRGPGSDRDRSPRRGRRKFTRSSRPSVNRPSPMTSYRRRRRRGSTGSAIGPGDRWVRATPARERSFINANLFPLARTEARMIPPGPNRRGQPPRPGPGIHSPRAGGTRGSGRGEYHVWGEETNRRGARLALSLRLDTRVLRSGLVNKGNASWGAKPSTSRSRHRVSALSRPGKGTAWLSPAPPRGQHDT